MKEIVDALRFLDANDRDQWVRIGMAIKSELGDAGWSAWADWSERGHSYKERDARAVWRSIKASGGIRIGTLYKLARDAGWKGEEPAMSDADYAAARAKRAREDRIAAQKQERLWSEAARRAQEIISRCKPATHDYLRAKGFPEETGLVLGPALIVPMRSVANYKVTQSLQQIWFDGEAFKKKFLPNGRAKGAVFAIGQGRETWLCEGFATGLSVKAGLSSVYATGKVLVCFSASNLAHVSSKVSGRRFVIADNDASGTGEKYAKQTGLPFWQPPDIDTDANDFHARYGVRALAQAMQEIRKAA